MSPFWSHRRAIGVDLDLPSKCFISHSYADTDAIQSLLKTLPRSVEPFIFPPITVPPEERVSDDLVRAILDCPGLIFLTSPSSAKSFWVTFEKDYALRAKKKVFAYDPLTGELRPYGVEAPWLPVFAAFSESDRETVLKITDFMQRERYFDILVPEEGPDMRYLLTDLLKAGGCCVYFVSKKSYQAIRKWLLESVKIRKRGLKKQHWGIMVSLEPLGEDIESERRSNAVYLHPHKPGYLDWNRVDNLIVNIYRFIYDDSGTEVQ